jgi:hypothetical protein
MASRRMAFPAQRISDFSMPQVRRALFALALCLTCLTCFAFGGQSTSQQKTCSQDASLYEAQNYKVRSIRFTTFFGKNTPVAFIFAVQKLLNNQYKQIKTQLPLQEGQVFTVSAYVKAQDKLRELLGEPAPGERVKFVYLEPSIEACQAGATPPTLDVVYQIFTTQGLSYVTSVFETSPDKFSRQTLGILKDKANKTLPQPYLGYNKSRGFFGGGRASVQTNTIIFDSLDVDASGSASSAVADIGFKGTRDFDKGLISYTQWRFGYRYWNIPTDEITLKEGTLLAQSFTATRPIGALGLVFRFGSSVEGGNRQSNLSNDEISNTNLAQSAYGAVKMYIGGTASLNRQSWKASYALQLGENTRGAQIDYVKHIVDSAYSVRFLPREHLPLRVDLQLTAGAIQKHSGQIPVGERFFGGNAQREFIQGDDWDIGSSPLIRSFAQNRFNRIATGAPIGGENFVSANVTISQAVWKRSVIPESVSNDPDLKIALGGAILTNKSVAIADGLNTTNQFKLLVNGLPQNLSAKLNQLQTLADSIKSSSPPQTVLDAISNLDDDIADAKDAIDTVTQSKSVLDIQPLILGFPDAGVASAIDSVSEDVNTVVQSLQTAGLTGQIDSLKQAVNQLTDGQATVRAEYQKVKNLAYVQPQTLQPVVDKLTAVNTLLQSIKQTLDRLAANSNDDVKNGVGVAQKYVAAAMDNVQAAQSNGENAKVNLELLAQGLGAVTPAAITGITESIKSLQKPLSNAGLLQDAAQLDASAKDLTVLQVQIKAELKKIATPVVERKADQDIAYTARTLDVIFRELNIVAISPVLMFDAARIGEKEQPRLSETRYGLGTGIKFSLVTMDVTAGYSWNLKHRSGEPRGAFVFSLNISDLFR